MFKCRDLNPDIRPLSPHVLIPTLCEYTHDLIAAEHIVHLHVSRLKERLDKQSCSFSKWLALLVSKRNLDSSNLLHTIQVRTLNRTLFYCDVSVPFTIKFWFSIKYHNICWFFHVFCELLQSYHLCLLNPTHIHKEFDGLPDVILGYRSKCSGSVLFSSLCIGILVFSLKTIIGSFSPTR